ncbi:MAG TPA: tetraacyldisaccharide 4'-kinase [Smithella sp.]|nr:tetraacyldisaccharide 4'-kinase [Smithella sp.]
MKRQNMRVTVEAIWSKEKIGFQPLELFLRGASVLYRFAIFLRNVFFEMGLFRKKKLPCKVISVGNITVGGTGKTPMVIYLADLLKAQGFHPAVLSRGYKGKTKAPVNIVSDGKRVLMKPEDCGDEPVLIAKSLPGIPVLTGSQRLLTGQVALEQLGADLLILDDAFQHRQLVREIDVVLLNTTKPFGNGALLPAGPLREPPSALKRAHFIVRTGDDAKITSVFSDQPEYPARHQAVALINGATGQASPLQNLRGRRVCAFAGIAKPEAFRRTLIDIGAQVVMFMPFPDHHNYSREDIREIQKMAMEEKADIIVTTEKDGVKLNRFHMFLEKIDLLRIRMVFPDEEQAFVQSLMEKLKQS